MFYFDGHTRARIGDSQWITIRTCHGKVLAVPGAGNLGTTAKKACRWFSYFVWLCFFPVCFFHLVHTHPAYCRGPQDWRTNPARMPAGWDASSWDGDWACGTCECGHCADDPWPSASPLRQFCCANIADGRQALCDAGTSPFCQETSRARDKPSSNRSEKSLVDYKPKSGAFRVRAGSSAWQWQRASIT